MKEKVKKFWKKHWSEILMIITAGASGAFVFTKGYNVGKKRGYYESGMLLEILNREDPTLETHVKEIIANMNNK